MSEINHKGILYDVFDALSNKDMTGWSLKDRYTAGELTGKVVYNSCLSNETPDAEVFPDGVTGMTFIVCNCDNILLPVDTVVIDCTTRRFQVQNDGEDWIIEE